MSNLNGLNLTFNNYPKLKHYSPNKQLSIPEVLIF